MNIYRQRLTDELEDSEPTAMFSLYLNNLFDCLNRRYPGEGIKYNSPDIDVSKLVNYKTYFIHNISEHYYVEVKITRVLKLSIYKCLLCYRF